MTEAGIGARLWRDGEPVPEDFASAKLPLA